MQGSPYDDETRERVLALCAMPKMTPAKVARQTGIPRSTVYDWVNTARERSPEYIAEERENIRRMMRRAYNVAARVLEGMEAQSKAAKIEKAEIDRVLTKLLSDEELDDATRKKMVEIVRAYTGTSMAELSRVLRESMSVRGELESKLVGDEGENANEVHVQLTLVDPAKGQEHDA